MRGKKLCGSFRDLANAPTSPLRQLRPGHAPSIKFYILNDTTRLTSTRAFTTSVHHTSVSNLRTAKPLPTRISNGTSSGRRMPTCPTMDGRSISSSVRTGDDGTDIRPSAPSPSVTTMRYAIALGSNMGDRLHWIEQACREMDAAGIRVIATSGLVQTTAMYVEHQDDFLNGACIVETSLEPIELMKALQGIENKLGRVKVIDKGPRNIDLDILTWEKGAFNSDYPDLHIPHKLMNERDFVLEPLKQLLPRSVIKDDGMKRYKNMFPAKSLPKTPSLQTRIELSKSLPPLSPRQLDKKTHVMAILNLTPDSFSDGGRHDVSNEEYLRTTILSHLSNGATIIELGAQSSRPGAPDIAAEEEIARLMPALEILAKLRRDPQVPPFSISIDTYRALVAEAAVKAGADIINDISAGLLDPDMLPTVARLGCTYIMMHMRGTPHTMTSKENTTYDGDLIGIIKDELADRLAAAEAAGVRRWRIILDPGIGFAKTASQNLEILRRLRALTHQYTRPAGHKVIDGVERTLVGMPWLIGASRKGFVGKVTGVAVASERAWGTAATVTAAVRGRADIVRVHDVKEMAQVARMSDAIYRPTKEDADADA